MDATISSPHGNAAAFISPADLLHHWQGHRRLTRRVIEAFPEDKLFSFSVGGMPPFFRTRDGVCEDGGADCARCGHGQVDVVR